MNHTRCIHVDLNFFSMQCHLVKKVESANFASHLKPMSLEIFACSFDEQKTHEIEQVVPVALSMLFAFLVVDRVRERERKR